MKRGDASEDLICHVPESSRAAHRDAPKAPCACARSRVRVTTPRPWREPGGGSPALSRRGGAASVTGTTRATARGRRACERNSGGPQPRDGPALTRLDWLGENFEGHGKLGLPKHRRASSRRSAFRFVERGPLNCSMKALKDGQMYYRWCFSDPATAHVRRPNPTSRPCSPTASSTM